MASKTKEKADNSKIPVTAGVVAQEFKPVVEEFLGYKDMEEKATAGIKKLKGDAKKPGILWKLVEQHGAHLKTDASRDSVLIHEGYKFQVQASVKKAFSGDVAIPLLKAAGKAVSLKGSINGGEAFIAFKTLLLELAPVSAKNPPNDDQFWVIAQATAEILHSGVIQTREFIDEAAWSKHKETGTYRVPTAVDEAVYSENTNYSLHFWKLDSEET